MTLYKLLKSLVGTGSLMVIGHRAAGEITEVFRIVDDTLSVRISREDTPRSVDITPSAWRMELLPELRIIVMTHRGGDRVPNGRLTIVLPR